MIQPRVVPYTIRVLGVADRERLLAHLLTLDSTDRALRFGAVIDDDAIARYVAGIDFEHATVLGAVSRDEVLLGVAHVALAGGVAELGLSVTNGARRRGVGRALGRAALRAAIRMNAREFRFDYAATNVGMRRLAEDLGMADHAQGSHSIARRLLGGAAQDAPAVAS